MFPAARLSVTLVFPPHFGQRKLTSCSLLRRALQGRGLASHRRVRFWLACGATFETEPKSEDFKQPFFSSHQAVLLNQSKLTIESVPLIFPPQNSPTFVGPLAKNAVADLLTSENHPIPSFDQ